MQRLFTFRMGRRAERAAARFLKRDGHLIVERNVLLGRDEIDIVSTSNGTVVLTEVRYRKVGIRSAADSVGWAKKAAMIRAARAYRRRERLASTPLRIDLLLVTRAGREWTIRQVKAYCDW